MDVARHSYTGRQRLVYYNNSPDTLAEVYYHLYYEAFKPGSMMDVRDRSSQGGGLRINRLPAELQGSVRIDSMWQEGALLSWNVEQTILHAVLARPLAPGDSTVLELRWGTQVPYLTRRGGWMSREGVEYSMSQWYPKMCEYDENGWHNDEYVAREFYGVYGTFDVAITIPAKYVLGGTGVVTNPEEVGCGYELTDADTLILPPDATPIGNKTWRFHAENVHDFAWVADPDYVHMIRRAGGVTIHALVTTNYAGAWRYVPQWTEELMAYYGGRFGAYAWPQFTVAMAGDGGMEYPQLIMITGNRTQTSLAGVIAHELGHQWYYGMIGNNETQEAWLDEGFTQYLTDEAARDVLGTQLGPNPYTGLDRVVYPWNRKRWANTEGAYDLAISGYDEPLSTFHDWFREPSTAGLVYSRGEAVLRMVQYMLGDSLFDAAMHHYYDRWRFHHPYVRDFEHAIEEASGMRLDWFFSQWVGRTKLCDYAIDDLRSEPAAGGYATTLALSNRNEAVMPLDLLLTFDDGTTASANIPVEPWRKPGMDYILPRWPWVAPTYTTTFTTPRRVVSAVIDTSTLLFDIDRTNNSYSTGFLANLLPPTDVAWYRRWDLRRPMDRYTVRMRPTLWYSRADGAQIGLLADGGYAFDRYNATLGAAYNVKSGRIDYNVGFGTRTDLFGRLGEVNLTATNNDGVQRWAITYERAIKPFTINTALDQRVTFGAEREVLVGGNYPNAVAPWSGGGYNTLGLGYSVGGRGEPGSFKASANFDASFASRTEFTQWRIAATGTLRSWPLEPTLDLFCGASLGTPPAQRLFTTAGATARDQHSNVVQRLAMNAEPDFAARNHLVLPTQGFLLSTLAAPAAERYGNNVLNYRLTLGRWLPFATLAPIWFLPKIDLRLYTAGGWIFADKVTFAGFEEFHAEAGAVASLDLPDAFLPGVIEDALDSPAPIRLSFWVPAYASSRLVPGSPWAYRWAIGISM